MGERGPSTNRARTRTRVGGTDPDTRFGRGLPDRAWFWAGANALLGPIVGVTSMVWALQTLQPGVTQAIAAMAPLIAIPTALWLEGYRAPAGFLVGVESRCWGSSDWLSGRPKPGSPLPSLTVEASQLAAGWQADWDTVPRVPHQLVVAAPEGAHSS